MQTNKDWSLLQTPERFAETVGVSVDTVRGWVERGYVPSVRIGRRRLVNTAALYVELIEQAKEDRS